MLSYFSKCASVFLSAKSLMATTSIVGWSKSSLNRLLPILPKPLIPIRTLLLFKSFYNMCLCALYEERTNAPLSTCLNPRSLPIFSYSANSSGVTKRCTGKCFLLGCKY